MYWVDFSITLTETEMTIKILPLIKDLSFLIDQIQLYVTFQWPLNTVDSLVYTNT